MKLGSMIREGNEKSKHLEQRLRSTTQRENKVPVGYNPPDMKLWNFVHVPRPRQLRCRCSRIGAITYVAVQVNQYRPAISKCVLTGSKHRVDQQQAMLSKQAHSEAQKTWFIHIIFNQPHARTTSHPIRTRFQQDTEN